MKANVAIASSVLAGVLLLVASAWTGVVAAAEKEAGVAITVTGITINRPIPAKDQKFVMDQTQLTFCATAAGKTLIDIDNDASKIAAFTDDRGTDLGTDVHFFRQMGGDQPGETLTFTVTTRKTPAAGALKLSLKGEVGLRCGVDLKTARQAKLELKPDAKITVGPVALTVKSVEFGEGEGGTSLTLTGDTTEDALARLKGFTFALPDGAKIAAQRRSQFSMGFGGKRSVEMVYALTTQAKEIAVEASYYEKIETIKAPIDVTVGIGL